MDDSIYILGAGVIGLVCAVELARVGKTVNVFEKHADLQNGCSHWAGGMLAPFCEAVTSEPVIIAAGIQALEWWQETCPEQTESKGTLVVIAGRDASELQQFAQRTSHFERITHEGIAALEPDVAEHFRTGLFFKDEGLVHPRFALPALVEKLQALGGTVHFNSDAEHIAPHKGLTIDCRGLSARAVLPNLRGVKGEMLMVHTPDVNIGRAVRLLRPRQPVYIIPRGDNVYMIGATMIETESPRITARSIAELLSGAYAIHPAFADAEILEIGAGVRPAFPDNLPYIERRDNVLYVNGAFRHGFLLAPALALTLVKMIIHLQNYEEASTWMSV